MRLLYSPPPANRLGSYSDKPHVFSYNIHKQALVLEQFLSHLRLQRFALFGHSMGGSIAIEAAGLLGERVTTLLVSEPWRQRRTNKNRSPVCLHDKVTGFLYSNLILCATLFCRLAPEG